MNEFTTCSNFFHKSSGYDEGKIFKFADSGVDSFVVNLKGRIRRKGERGRGGEGEREKEGEGQEGGRKESSEKVVFSSTLSFPFLTLVKTFK